MTRKRLSFGVALLTTTLMLTVIATPVAALTIKGQGVYSVFADGSVRGIAIVDRYNSDPRLNAVVGGLDPSEEYHVDGRSIGCDGTPSAANRVFRLSDTTDGDGGLNYSGYLVIELENAIITSIWISPAGGGPTVCSISFNFEKYGVAAGDVNGDGALGVIRVGPDIHGNALVQKLPNGQARLSVAIDPSDPSGNTYQFTFANRACGVTPTRTYKVKLEDVLATSLKSKSVDMSQDQLDALRSVRLRNVTTGENIGCAPLGIIAILIG